MVLLVLFWLHSAAAIGYNENPIKLNAESGDSEIFSSTHEMQKLLQREIDFSHDLLRYKACLVHLFGKFRTLKF